MRRLTLSLAALALCACATPDDRPAPAAANDSTYDDVRSVAGATWGATAEQLIAARGAPEFRDQGAEGLQVMGYSETLAGQPVQLLYMVHPEHGLFRAGYMAQVTSPEQCASTMGLIDQELSRKYTGMEITESRRGSTDQPPCEAFLGGTGGYLKTRRAPSGNSIMLGLNPGSGGIMITFSTPAADEWERRKRAGQL
jgi:hypothetical protein